jgi:flavin reductase (DIM6/NTAB) family NADH-FMN oxidoreductase RutF
MTAEQICDPEAFRRAMGQFATGVAVVTVLDAAGQPRGMTVSSLTSVSLAPPLLLYGLDRSAVNFVSFAEAEAFAVNILSRDQEALSNRFADPSRPDWPKLPWHRLVSGAPLIDGTVMAIDCRREQIVEIADHLVIFGQALAVEGEGSAAPLLHHAGRYRGLAAG